MVVCSPVRWLTVMPPSTPGTSWLRSRMLANVPRIMTSWLPRREPYELKSRRSMPCSARYSPAGESGLIEPAGEMWSVVTESPSQTSRRAPSTSATMPGSGARPPNDRDHARLVRHPLEVRRLPHVRRVGRPREQLALGHVERAPRLVAGEDVG